MKKLILTTALLGIVAANSFGQGTIVFKVTAKSEIYSATDGTTASLAAIPTTGTVGSFGAVTYELLTAPSTTSLLSSPPLPPGTVPNGWTATPISAGSIGYSAPGLISSVTLTLPSGVAGSGNTIDMEIVAFTGTFASPTLFGYSGQTFANVTTANGLLSWVQPTGNPNATPPGTATAIPVGTSGFGSLVLVPVPEPSTIALGGLAAAALLAFRRKK